MPQRVKALAAKPDEPEFDPQKPWGRKGALIPTNYTLTSTWMLWHVNPLCIHKK